MKPMPPPLTYPGIYIQEQRSGSVSISGASTSVALFIGMTPRGPFEVPTMVTGFTRYQTLFGPDSWPREMSSQVRQFFLTGGSQAYMLRTAENAKGASVTLKNEAHADVLKIEAREWGKIGDSIRVEIDYDTPHPEETFNLTVYREQVKPNGELERVDAEPTYTDLTMNKNATRSVEKVLEGSQLVKATIIPLAGTIPSASIGGLVTATGNVLAMVRNAVTSATVPGTFRMWVDDLGPFVVSVPKNLASLSPDLEGIIKTATGLQVVVKALALSGTQDVLVVQSAIAGKTIRIESTPGASDIARTLQLGAGNGGLEIGAFVKWRPQPTGLAASLGELDVTQATALAPVKALGAAATGTITGIDLTTPGLPVAAGVVAPAVPADPTMLERGGAAGLAQLAINLDDIVSRLNAAFTSSIPVRWKAERQGLRIVLYSQDPGALAGLSTTTAKHGGGATDLTAAGIGYLPTASSNAAAYD